MDEGIYRIMWDDCQQFYPDDLIDPRFNELSLDYLALLKVKPPQWGGFAHLYVQKTDSGFTTFDFFGPGIGVEPLENVDLAIINRSDFFHGKGIKSGLEKIAGLDQLDDKARAYLRFYDLD